MNDIRDRYVNLRIVCKCKNFQLKSCCTLHDSIENLTTFRELYIDDFYIILFVYYSRFVCCRGRRLHFYMNDSPDPSQWAISSNGCVGYSCFTALSHGEDDRCLFHAFPVGYFLQMSPKLLTTRATTASRVGCVCNAMGDDMPFSAFRQQKCRPRQPTTQHTPAERRGAHCKQDLRPWGATSLQQRGFHHRPEGVLQHICRQASDSQLFASCVSAEQESYPCHVCPWVVGMVTNRSVSGAIRDWMVVRRRCKIQDH